MTGRETIHWDSADECWRWTTGAPDGPVGVTSAVFSSRAQGNIGAHVGDDADAVLANRARVASLAGLGSERVAGVSQVHGADVWLDFAITDGLIQAVRWSNGESPVWADALVTRRPDTGVAVGVADCLPVVLAWGETIAAVHAGWRGLAGGVLEAAVNAMRHSAGMSAFLDGVELRAAIGPSIGPCCLEVGEEVADRFPSTALVHRDGALRPFLDARGEARRRLVELGAVVDVLDVCTKCDERCFSHRAGGERAAGRQAALVSRTAAVT